MAEKKENVKIKCDSCKHKEYCKYEGLHKTKKEFSLALCSEEHFPVIEVELKCIYYDSDFNNCYIQDDLRSITALYRGTDRCLNS